MATTTIGQTFEILDASPQVKTSLQPPYTFYPIPTSGEQVICWFPDKKATCRYHYLYEPKSSAYASVKIGKTLLQAFATVSVKRFVTPSARPTETPENHCIQALLPTYHH